MFGWALNYNKLYSIHYIIGERGEGTILQASKRGKHSDGLPSDQTPVESIAKLCLAQLYSISHNVASSDGMIRTSHFVRAVTRARRAMQCVAMNADRSTAWRRWANVEETCEDLECGGPFPEQRGRRCSRNTTRGWRRSWMLMATGN